MKKFVMFTSLVLAVLVAACAPATPIPAPTSTPVPAPTGKVSETVSFPIQYHYLKGQKVQKVMTVMVWGPAWTEFGFYRFGVIEEGILTVLIKKETKNGTEWVPMTGGNRFALPVNVRVEVGDLKNFAITKKESGSVLIEVNPKEYPNAPYFTGSELQGTDALILVGDGILPCPEKYGNWGGFLAPAPFCHYNHLGNLIK